VRQPRAGQLDLGVVQALTVRVEHAVPEVRRSGRVAEVDQLAGRGIELGVRRHAAGRRPRRGAALLERLGIHPVRVAALVERRERLAAVDDDVRRRRVLHPAARAPAVAERLAGGLGDAGPERRPGGELGGEAGGAHEAVAVRRGAAAEPDRVHHAVAVERVVAADRGHHRVLGVAEVDAVERGRDRTLDDVELVGVVLDEGRPPRAGAVRVVVVRRQPVGEPADLADAHGGTAYAGVARVSTGGGNVRGGVATRPASG
jgi:hypothetical protein